MIMNNFEYNPLKCHCLDELFKDPNFVDPRPDSQYDYEQLKMGCQVEKEHTSSPVRAKIIAKDHLDEIPDYYTRLKKMEDSADTEDENPKYSNESLEDIYNESF
jgi:hypothetical protein